MPIRRRMRSFIARLMPKLAATPGVARAAASMALPPAITTMAPYVTADQPLSRSASAGRTVVRGHAGLFHDDGGFRSCRTWNRRRRHGAVAARRRHQPGARAPGVPNVSPVGRKILVGRFPGFADVIASPRREEQRTGAGADGRDVHAVPAAPWPAMQFAVRSAGGDPLTLVSAVRDALRQVDARCR